MAEVRFVDVTIRDGQLSVWAANMTIGMMLKAAPFAVCGVDDHVEHNGRAAEMAYPFICDAIINRLG